ncbi:MAG TPA: NAD(+) kinase [Pseudothermotoga sp.]|nr:NAD(+) kinase [Pseudothermotoga sp.]HOK82760.1 NAD(+) kinase [Pseudothermotoga sp.]HPP70802.1 NAD(+) kinase [Pseudothermotoga sp.]
MKISAAVVFRSDKAKEAKELVEKINEHIEIRQICEARSEKVDEKCDFAIIIGGDGTVLKAVKNLNIPIVGFKAGRIGFLAYYKLEEVDRFLRDLQEGRLVEEKRWMVKVQLDGAQFHGVNDIVFHTPSRQMSEFDVLFDGCSGLSFFADGILVSTPTGSTAYNLSLGGAIVIPNSDVIQILPIAPYYLQNRSIIVPSHRKTFIRTLRECEVLVDGLSVGSTLQIEITKSERYFTLLRPDYYDFFTVLKEKVGYGRGVHNEMDNR